MNMGWYLNNFLTTSIMKWEFEERATYFCKNRAQCQSFKTKFIVTNRNEFP